MQIDAAKDTLVYVGTYTGPKSKGIYLFRLQTANPEVSQNITLAPLGVAAETENPSFLESDRKRRRVVAANETHTFQGKPGGGVSSVAIDPATGQLRLFSRQSSQGRGPC